MERLDYLQNTRDGLPFAFSQITPNTNSLSRRSNINSFFVGGYPFTIVLSRTGRSSSPYVFSPCAGTSSHSAISDVFGIVAEMAMYRIFAIGSCLAQPSQQDIFVAYSTSLNWEKSKFPKKCHFSNVDTTICRV